MTKIQARLEEVESEATAAKEEAATLREVTWSNLFRWLTSGLLQVRDEVVKDRGDVQRRLDVLTEFFNKKEAELQKQLGLQSAKWDNTRRGWCDLNFHTFFRFGDVSTDAESTARKLISVTSELDSTGAQVLVL